MAWIKELARATLAYWWALMSSAVFTILSIFASVTQKNNEWMIRASFICASLFIVVALALAWRNENKKLLVELARSSKPEFQVDVSRLFHDVTPAQGIPWLDCGNTYVAKLSVVNVRPSPSSIQSIYVTLGDEEKRFVAESFKQRQLGWSRAGINRTLGGQSVTPQLWREETITDLLPSLSEPMTQGSHKEGWVYLTDLPSKDDSAGFNFYVVDAYGYSHGPFIPKAEMELGNVKRT